MPFLGVDTGGTFTDFVLFDEGELRVHKVLSTPDAPQRAILQGLAELGLDDAGLHLVHGSTVATNAALEGKGVDTVFISNSGFTDLLSIGRQTRAELYQLQPEPPDPPVPAERCLGIDCRMDAQGRWIEPLTAPALAELARQVAADGPRAVAVCLLHAWRDGAGERAIREALPDHLFVSLSSEVLPEMREYERASATWLNAWVGPLVEGYIGRLGAGLPRARLAVMQSSGDTVAASEAGRQAVRMLLSGPAGGLVGARFVGQTAGCERLLSFDMGGTSTDVALIDGEPRLTSEGRIGRYPVAVPMVDMHTIGAGGGSIAWLDDGGALQVGPQSAGAAPGPACYGQGGERPTVTDANLLLGRLRPDAFLGGGMRLDRAAAARAMQPLAEAMGCRIEQAARGVIRIANEHMARALRVISVQRGIDPRGLVLTSFGGAGGLHVCALAEALGLERALVPVHGGVLSALGMLATRPGRQLSRARPGLLAELPAEQLEQDFAELAEQGRQALQGEGVDPGQIDFERSLDLRYRGQSYTLNLPWSDVDGTIAAFEQAHESRYGHRMQAPVELLNLRLRARGPALGVRLAERAGQRPPAEPLEQVTMPGVEGTVAVYRRGQLAPGQRLDGPAVIVEQVATTWLAPGWAARADGYGNLLLQRG